MTFELNKYIILESLALVQEDEFNRPNWGKRAAYAGAAGVGLAMGNAGEFGSGVKHMIGSVTDGAQTALHGASNMGARTADYYKGPEAQKELGLHPAAQEAAQHTQDVHDAGHAIVSPQEDEDESGLGVLGTIGAATLGAGGLYGAYHGSKALGASRMGKDFKGGFHGNATHNRSSFPNKVGLSLHGGLSPFRRG